MYFMRCPVGQPVAGQTYVTMMDDPISQNAAFGTFRRSRKFGIGV